MSKEKTKNKNPIRNKGVWEFIKFTAISLLTSVLEIIVFSLLYYLIFVNLANVDFQFGYLDYSIAHGGLRAFLAFSISYVLAQIFNFIVQRKVTFKANNQVISSATLYALMILGIFFLQLWIPPMIHIPVANVIGEGYADLVIKNMMMFLSFVIQFPLNKWVIMKI